MERYVIINNKNSKRINRAYRNLYQVVLKSRRVLLPYELRMYTHNLMVVKYTIALSIRKKERCVYPFLWTAFLRLPDVVPLIFCNDYTRLLTYVRTIALCILLLCVYVYYYIHFVCVCVS